MRFPPWASTPENRAAITRVRWFNGICIAVLVPMVAIGFYSLAVLGPRLWQVVGTVAPILSIYLIWNGHRTFMERLEMYAACRTVDEVNAVARVSHAVHVMRNAVWLDPYPLYRASMLMSRTDAPPPRSRPPLQPPPPPPRKRPPPPNYDAERDRSKRPPPSKK